MEQTFATELRDLINKYHGKVPDGEIVSALANSYDPEAFRKAKAAALDAALEDVSNHSKLEKDEDEGDLDEELEDEI